MAVLVGRTPVENEVSHAKSACHSVGSYMVRFAATAPCAGGLGELGFSENGENAERMELELTCASGALTAAIIV